ncbi:MAG TPA: tRNA (adenosine(37)-N6)-threonylcarbamoyltransferase complex ATPase subunit type 1 TsaE [Micavibrio sp.]|nr:tRNA (adenosine(37)-N6)-threonylcarbamoyltransferase complex ATPase subunit type 1 TsaE [Micavibrio sp.]
MAVHETHAESETAALAAKIAASARSGDIFLLEGPLGAGKSVFARAFVRALCGKDTDVPSPTFTLVQTYETEEATLYHFDLYRLENPEEIYEIGWEDALSGGIVLVEWPQRLGPHAPRNATRIRIETFDGESRRITIDEK